MVWTRASGAVPPNAAFFSTSKVRAPRRAAEIAAARPALPPPTTRTSHCCIAKFRARFTPQILDHLANHEAPLLVRQAAFAPRKRDIHTPVSLTEKQTRTRRRPQTWQVVCVRDPRPGQLRQFRRKRSSMRMEERGDLPLELRAHNKHEKPSR